MGYKTLQLPEHLSKLIMNGYYLSPTGLISIILGLTMHGSSFKHIWSRAKKIRYIIYISPSKQKIF